MQLYAHNQNGETVFARQASKQQNYSCPECSNVVRVRSGSHRQPHFYHLSAMRTCSQSNKSMAHIQTQWRFLQSLPKDECRLERRFPLIQRIADVVWEERKLVFEIQCSPISYQEMQERNVAYQSQGYHVIWILHEKSFNKERLSASEALAKKTGCYYCNIDANGNGDIFDQFDWVNGGMRKTKLKALPIDIQSPFLSNKQNAGLQTIMERANQWQVHFNGDLTDVFHKKDVVAEYKQYIEKAKKIESTYRLIPIKVSSYEYLKSLMNRFIVTPYQNFLQMLVEKASR